MLQEVHRTLQAVWLAIIGLVAGVTGGLLGIGGSIVMIPGMTELLGPRQHLYQAAALMVNFFVAVPAVVQHRRAKAIDLTILRGLAPSAALGAVAGVAFSELAVFRGNGAIYLTGLFGVFLFFVAARDVVGLLSPGSASDRPPDGPRKRSIWQIAVLVGLPTGFVSGLLGVGGGVIAVPLQRRILGVPMRTAIANSAATIVVLSMVGTGLKHYGLIVNHPELAWYQPAGLAVFLIPTAIIGATVGGRLTHVLPIKIVRWAFVAVLVAGGARMVQRTIQSAAVTMSEVSTVTMSNGAALARDPHDRAIGHALPCSHPVVEQT